MYLAPLNFDRFFKKVFSDLGIAKAFIEDFLGVEIESIEELNTTKKFTDNAAVVEFDFRCKIDSGYVIIDMQQCYKPDVSQRFFLYHALNTGLQLESLPDKKLFIDPVTRQTRVVKDYRRLDPVITLVWMVDDCLGFDHNFVSYSLLPHVVLDYFAQDISKISVDELSKMHASVAKDIGNNTKEIGFLSKNSLIFLFQKNIVKDKRLEGYKRWFEFAEKTKSKSNSREDFKKFCGNDVFEEMIRRLERSSLPEADIRYMQSEKALIKGVGDWQDEIKKESMEEGKREGMKEGKREGLEEALQKLISSGMTEEEASKILFRDFA